MKVLMILNEPPYGNERCYNGLRLANDLLKREDGLDLTVFLICEERKKKTFLS